MEIKFTKQMLSTSIGETIYTIDWKLHKGLKQSQWRRYRIVCMTTGIDCAANREYKIQETYLRCCFSWLPRCLGGLGFGKSYDEVFWQDLDTTHPKDRVFDTYQEAVEKINIMVKYVKDYENREEEIVKEKIISWHPDEESM